jgi:SAM-dependent methyltransferase
VEELKRFLPASVRLAYGRGRAVVRGEQWRVPARDHWVRKVMLADTERELQALQPAQSSAVEISGKAWDQLGWRDYTRVVFPAFDLCNPPDQLPGQFDVVICEQVLEHVLDPIRAVRTLRDLCRPDGHVFVSTPFLIRLHYNPGDFWRFTPDGMWHLLESQGLAVQWVRSWGNRHCMNANLERWAAYWPWRSLRNEPYLPLVVWALARPR